jgi:glycosyltransferase involved in cell wall biosynthesis
VYEVPESTSRFEPGERDQARRAAGVTGDPLVLWVGHLDANKDPLTVLDGVSQAAQVLPRLRLYCCYGTAPLLPAVQRRIAGDSRLNGRVQLLGRVPHGQVEQLMRAADVFVSGSHREGSGYSVIEALACGLAPVVTDIPSFRSLTGAGAVGALWPRGDADSLCERLVRVAAHPQAQIRAAARRHFDQELSFDAVGRKLALVYRDLLERPPHRRESSRERCGFLTDHA